MSAAMTPVNKDIENLLRSHRLKRTSARMEILSLLLGSSHTISYNDISDALGDNFDKSTVYRTLNSFEEKGIIHAVNDGTGGIKYAVTREEGREAHVHFKCDNCSQTYCLPDTKIPNVKAPRGFVIKNSSLLINGTCKYCS
ncbi:Fur family transcriptional regulator, ferric uptake regulator [Sinomicrobium oceani]|uniref:Fur family transcriptional regulator, ferric uptake regulator n=1 Tax=Sinomicrobium oceani TaxID=1150368 RepID=A0A1K1RUR8_9FLAO|nr:Fur family transcriptional regulator [Sinomicrobium oceani]SFW75674.1 Fur family transcriptional regulator, ferric uptake regulator [Sinomicrobium oceani]